MSNATITSRRGVDRIVRTAGDVDDAFPAVPRRHLAVDLVLRSVALERKLAALDAHTSQVGPLQRLLGADGYRRLVAGEWFRRAQHDHRHLSAAPTTVRWHSGRPSRASAT